jgi:AmmeMemoRadiSam system protein A
MVSLKSHPLVELALQAIREYLETQTWVRPSTELLEAFPAPAGVFVCLKKNGHLRGCVGTYRAERLTVAEEVIHNAVASAIRDPRFNPLHLRELDVIECSVDVLSPPEPATRENLDPSSFGVIVVQGSRRGLLLPDVEGIQSVEQQIRIAKEKAGITIDEDCRIYRFQVQRYR